MLLREITTTKPAKEPLNEALVTGTVIAIATVLLSCGLIIILSISFFGNLAFNCDDKSFLLMINLSSYLYEIFLVIFIFVSFFTALIL